MRPPTEVEVVSKETNCYHSSAGKVKMEIPRCGEVVYVSAL